LNTRSESLLLWNPLFVDRLVLSYWVCEKSDGVRVLLVVLTLENDEQFVCIVRPLHITILFSLSSRSTGTTHTGKSPASSFLIMNTQNGLCGVLWSTQSWSSTLTLGQSAYVLLSESLSGVRTKVLLLHRKPCVYFALIASSQTIRTSCPRHSTKDIG
jgi:hypothetical protein